MQIGRKLYYELVTGNVIVDTGDKSGDVVETTIEQDFESYAALAERVPETVGCLQLIYGQYAQDFASCNGYRINPVTEEILFSYPDDPDEPPISRKPLSEQVADQEQRLADVELVMAELLTGGI